MKHLLAIGLILCVLCIAPDGFAAQKVIFCATAPVDYAAGTITVCNRHSANGYPGCGLNSLLSSGWEVKLTTQKTQYVESLTTCQGVEYVMSKQEAQTPHTDDSDVQSLKREIDLLKRENRLLQQEIDQLKKATSHDTNKGQDRDSEPKYGPRIK